MEQKPDDSHSDSVMFSEAEQRELQELARSARVREEFRMIRDAGRHAAQHLSIDDLLQWLTFLNQVTVRPPPPRPFPVYANVRL